MPPVWRLLSKLFLLAGVAAIVFPFVYPMKNGKPLLDINDISLFPDSDNSSPLFSGAGDEWEGGAVTVYRWQDEDGTWHFSNEEPVAGQPHSTIIVDPSANLTEGIDGAAGTDGADSVDVEENNPLQQLLDLREAMEERAEQQQRSLDEL